MDKLKSLFENNRHWAEDHRSQHPGFFEQLAEKQSPEILFIGCADSRVPPSVVLDLAPGSLFVHRNIANIVADNDINMLSVIQYAVAVLKVKHIIVCGHYGCGGVEAALTEECSGYIGSWLEPLRDIFLKHQDALAQIDDPVRRQDRLCELNVMEQVAHVGSTPVVTDARRAGQELHIHGWIYNLKSGLMKDLNVSVQRAE